MPDAAAFDGAVRARYVRFGAQLLRRKRRMDPQGTRRLTGGLVSAYVRMVSL